MLVDRDGWGWRAVAGRLDLARLKASLGNGLAAKAMQRHLAALIIGLVAVMGASTFVAFIVSNSDQARVRAYIYETRDVRLIQFALLNAETGVRGVVLSGQPSYIAPYIEGLGALNQASLNLYATIDAYAAWLPLAKGQARPVTGRIAALREIWANAIALGMDHRQAEAQALLETGHANVLMDELRGLIGAYLAYRSDTADQEWRRIAIEQNIALAINLLGALIAIGATGYAFRRSRLEARGREEAIAASTLARRQVETLFSMTDILQSAATGEDANAVLRATATQLLPECGGVLYTFNNSRDRLDLSAEWGPPAQPVPVHITPDACWALKRGKPHVNSQRENALRCAHSGLGGASLEIPIIARGEVHGLLVLRGAALDDAAALKKLQPIAVAMADGMSLALSNIALRERLRNQALRDPLTSLYNRRFLEEMLERLSTEAERRHTPLAVIMMDLDHFKLLNDRHGHAAGDLVLRDVAASVLACLRPTDVACRYGGEELAILLPDCTLDAAMGKAEQIRVRIADATSGALSLTASFGVAAMPETCSRGAELLPAADAALYQAKDSGRDRVVAAPPRPSAEMIQLSNSGRSAPDARRAD